MGTVIEEHISGDNDAPIFPTRYIMYHKYCDQCGSFDLTYWIEPENHLALRARQQQLQRVARWAVVAVLLGVIGALAGLILLLIPALLVLAGALLGSWWLERRIVVRGARCRACDATYTNESGFLADHGSNPRGYSEENIPPPAGQGIRITGPILGPVDETDGP